MSHKQDKAAKRKAKLKARKAHAELHRLHLAGRVAGALMDLCADVLPEYIDDSKGIDLVGRNIIWRSRAAAALLMFLRFCQIIRRLCREPRFFRHDCNSARRDKTQFADMQFCEDLLDRYDRVCYYIWDKCHI